MNGEGKKLKNPGSPRQDQNAAMTPMAKAMRPGAVLGRGGGPHAMMKGEKPKDFKGAMKKLLKYMEEFKIQTALVLLLAVGSTVFAIFGPKILGRATTTLVQGVVSALGGGPGIDFSAVGGILSLALGLYGVAAIFSYIQGWIMAGVSAKLTFRLRKDLQAKINRMPLGYFDSTSHGEVLSKNDQRCGYGQPDPQPKPLADDQLGSDASWGLCDDAQHQLADDSCCAVDNPHFSWDHSFCSEQVAKILPSAAGVFRTCERSY